MMAKGKYFVRKKKKGKSDMKETITIIIVLLIIFGGAIYVQYLLDETSAEINDKLDLLKEKILNEQQNNSEEIEKLMEEILQKWEEINESWSIIILHSELDSIQVSLTRLSAQIKEGELDKTLEELETSKFLINHIKEKEGFSLKNIF